jgi:energy-converting hydrogenase B subunit P
MCKFVLVSKKVQNMGGYIVENHFDFPFRDLVVGNPFDENIKLPVPIYSMEEVKAIKELGIITHEMQEGESLVDAIKKVRDQVGEEPKRDSYW